jgi:hypothetical protein
MKFERIVLAFLFAPLVTPIVIMIGARNTTRSFRDLMAIFLLVAGSAYIAAFLFGIPALVLYRKLRWNHPLLYLIGGALIGSIVSLILDWPALSSASYFKYRVIAGALSAFLFRLILGENRPLREAPFPVKTET